MSHIIIGKTDGRNLALDLDALLRGRMLVQANSGKGKSWLLRRIAEQLFGKVQVIIIDPEGEFASLREKFGYVLVGRGGETPADPRSAALVAHKLLELRASAVCDLYEMKPSARHEFVQRFLDAMIDAPKNLWHPCVVMVDEAHVYCPEKGAGESMASEAMIGLATRGRKRGFACIFATQRLGKLRKDAAAELLNVMIGGTFIDVDRKRAADALGIYGADQKKFFDEIKVLPRGKFFALGPALSLDRVLVEVGDVETTHPEAGSARHAAEPPPAPEKIRALLPKLADLPKAAEEKARTETELRAEIRSLKAKIRTASAPKVQPTTAKATLRKFTPDEVNAALLPHLNAIIAATSRQLQRWIDKVNTIAAAVGSPPDTTIEWPSILSKMTASLNKISGGEIHARSERATGAVIPGRGPAPPSTHPRPDVVAADENKGDLSRPQKAILRAIAEFEAIGRPQISKSWIAARAGASYTSGAYANNLGYLRSNGYIVYPGPDQAALTDKGRGAAGEIEPPATSEDMLDSCLKLLSRPQQAILKALYEKHPEAVNKVELSEMAGASASSGAYANNLGALRSAGMIEYPGPGRAKCAD